MEDSIHQQGDLKIVFRVASEEIDEEAYLQSPQSVEYYVQPHYSAGRVKNPPSGGQFKLMLSLCLDSLRYQINQTLEISLAIFL